MSGFWIKWEKGLTRKPEVLQIAARLHMPPTQAAGTLMLLMEWLDDSVRDLSADGHAVVRLVSLKHDFIDGLVGISGFADTLVEVGWLRVKGDDLVFVNAGKHNGISSKRRALDAERKREVRSEKRPQSVRKMSAPNRTESGPEQSRAEHIGDTNVSPPPAAPVKVETRKRNLVMDELATIAGIPLAEIGSDVAKRLNAVISRIKQSTPDLTVEEIRRRAANYRTHMSDGTTLTPEALAKHWGLCHAPNAFADTGAKVYKAPFA